MKRESIVKTVLCYFSSNDSCYVAESPLFDVVAGTGETEEEAMQMFHNMLNEAYIEYLQGNVVGYEKPGRPKKGGVDFHTTIQPDAKKTLMQMAKDIEISLGEAVEYLLFCHEKKTQSKAAARVGSRIKAVSEGSRAVNKGSEIKKAVAAKAASTAKYDGTSVKTKKGKFITRGTAEAQNQAPRKRKQAG